MYNFKISSGSVWSLALWIFTCSLTCRGQEESANCDYIYLLQPPSELPCNPYQLNDRINITYSVALECVVANFVAEPQICWFQMSKDMEPQVVVPGKHFQYSVNQPMVGGFVLHQSVLQISEANPPTNNDIYWCQLCTADKDTQNNSSTPEVSATRLTIYDPQFYTALPPCPNGTSFHLAESVCVNNETVPQDSPSNCTSSDSCDGEDIFPLRTVVIAGGSTIGVVLILLAVVLTICCLHVRRRRIKVRGHNQKMENYRATEVDSHATPTTGLEQEEGQTPPNVATNNITTGMSGRHQQAVTPSPVTPQRPCRPAIHPPTLVNTVKMPVSARKRAASLLRQLRRPHNGVDNPSVDDGNIDHVKATSADHTNKQGSTTPRKKPYKSLEVNTVDVPHLYMTRAKSPWQKKRKPPPPPPLLHLQYQPRTESREKLLLTATVSGGYVLPDGTEEQQPMYKEIDPDREDYLGLYTVPRQRSPSTSSEEHPIYEEPRPS